MKIKAQTYEERMIDFFEKQLKMSKSKLARVERKRFYSVSERMEMLSEVGEEVSYYENVLKMLEEKAK